MLTDSVNVEIIALELPKVMEILRSAQQQRANRFYAAAVIANASAHPRLAEALKKNGGLFRKHIFYLVLKSA